MTSSLISEATVPTESAARYLGQLCKHFAHRVEASWAEDYSSGRIAFDMGSCELRAADGALQLKVLAADAAGLDRVENVIARHLERFMFREPSSISWKRAA